ncbi:MAG TPA: PAS domain S-box protein, partial [Pyrinomonadaceae bacterium]|nr:PAS domain S-box protein [Pyrinomonadaceae bacterium]
MTTETKELERLREQVARQSIVTETVSDAIITIDEESIILFANRSAERVFGYKTEELVGAKLTMLMPDYLRHVHEAGLARYVETGVRHISWEGVELPGLHRTGREMTLEVSFGEFRDERGRHYFTGVARDVTERKRAERYQSTLYSLTRILAESPTTEEAVAGILRTICEGLGWEMGALWSVQPGEGVLRCVETWHDPSVTFDAFDAESRARRLSPGEGLPGSVWQTRSPAWVRDVLADETFTRTEGARRDGIHAAFAFSVFVRGEVIGVIEFFSREVREPDAALLAIVVPLGGQIGQVMERKRAEDERARLQAEVIRIQEAQLAELSTPLIPIT